MAIAKANNAKTTEKNTTRSSRANNRGAAPLALGEREAKSPMGKLEDFEIVQLKHDIPDFNVGDTVDVHVRIVEGDKQRIQIFTGTVISRRGTSNREAFTVRRIVAGEGVERVFPLHSPWIEEIKVRRSGKVRRAKLYYLRERSGRSARIKEKVG